MNDKITADTILEAMKLYVEEKRILSPDIWIDSAHKLTTLLGDEEIKLYELQQIVAKIKLGFLENSNSVSAAKLKTDATDQYKEYKIQQAKINQIEEYIRVAKLRAKLASGM